MSLASHTIYPSGGRLGRRPRTWSRLLFSSASAVIFAAILVGIVAAATRRPTGSHRAAAALRQRSAPSKKILEAATIAPIFPPAVSPKPQADLAVNSAPRTAASAPPQVDFAPVVPHGAAAAPPEAPPAAFVAAEAPPAAASRQAAPSAGSAAFADTADEVSAAVSPPPAAPTAPALAGDPVAAPPSPSASGLYAAYLSASQTAGEAESLLAPMMRKYAAEIHGRRLSYHRMRVDGAAVYRLRVGDLSEADAESLCEKLKAASAPCDVGPE